MCLTSKALMSSDGISWRVPAIRRLVQQKRVDSGIQFEEKRPRYEVRPTGSVPDNQPRVITGFIFIT